MKGYTTVNIQTGLIKRVDAVFAVAGYPTRAGLIQDCIRRSLERFEAKIRNGTIPNQRGEKEEFSDDGADGDNKNNTKNNNYQPKQNQTDREKKQGVSEEKNEGN